MPQYPMSAKVSHLFFYIGTNFGYYHFFFRRNGNRSQFAAFLLVNYLVSSQIAEIINPGVLHHYAAFLNNDSE